ncbi:hypothetical protein OCS_01752 [Ophiocordyceps sinensis CO18]|uniref:Uncharacterized protein n=1 Tax=Ophiocordyceps sinensis (strain Co18 / CGMCC 3.14243) TaxID=911162 RepID=T5AAN3_OPHSC|nr:hypothetical protein OCS_01752 [Ophiocordyceps sinensis CO18]
MVSPIPGYGVDIIEWDVEVSPGWHELINGTVEQVYDQVLDIKPDWNPLDVPAAAAAPGKRGYKVKRGNVICGVWASATRGAIINGISYLRRVRGSATSGPGPGNCGRGRCSRNAAIWWCNDVSRDSRVKHVMPCRLTGPLTPLRRIEPTRLYPRKLQPNRRQRQIVDSCAPKMAPAIVSGQNFEGGNWTTIVLHDSDRC